MNADTLIGMINTLGSETRRIFQALIANIGAVLFFAGLFALIVMLFYGVWEVKRNKSTVSDILSDHGGKIILIVLLMIAGGLVQSMKPSTSTGQNQYESIRIVQR